MKGKALGEALAALGVIGSMIFVGLEIRQNTVAVRGSTMQAISDASVQLMAQATFDARFNELAGRMFRGETYDDFTLDENMMIQGFFLTFLRGLENTYFQWREGLVSEAVFESYGWKDALLHTKRFQYFWERRPELVISPEFIEFFETRVPVRPTS